MKHIHIYISMMLVGLLMASCSHSENETLPDFLDGTEYGILLKVDHTSDNDLSMAAISSDQVSFDVSFDGDQRPVDNITIHKSYGGTKVEHAVLTSFPASVSLSAADLVNGISGLTVGDLAVGDAFNIEFTIKYSDGKTVSRFGTRLNPNFTVSITE